jgi:Ca2+-binding RTX toxin-like protein
MPNSSPVLAGLITSVVFDEQLVNGAAQLLDPNVDFTDVDGSFTGGDLIVSGLLPEDSVGIRNEGTGAGQIAVTGGNIRFGNVIIASFTGGTAGTQLVVTFNASATSAAIDALIQNLTYANSSDAPTATRNLVISIHDAAGAAAIQPTSFSEVTGLANPFNGVDVGVDSAPTFADLDGDGDLDAVIGEEDGVLNYYRNTGTALAPVFVVQTGAANPFNGVDVGSYSTPSFADLDGDGDLDAVIGEDDGTLNYYRNTGTALAPVFTVQTGAANPFNGVDVGVASTLSFADLDGDGDLDALIGELDGTLRYYRNTGTALAPVFTEQTGAANPFNGVNVGFASAPSFADLDGDGDLDALIGEGDGVLNYYRNTGTALAPVFTEQTGAANPFNGVDVGLYSTPTFADLDGDGDLDALIGEEDGVLNYVRNTTPTAATSAFAEQTGAANPFDGVNVGIISAPSFADLDGDGDLDVVIGEDDGVLNYYRNTGTALAPIFTVQTGAANPFTGIDAGFASTPSFADLDGDGDLDALIGEDDGTLNYYRNTGTALAPVFTVQTGAANPFNGVDVGFASAPSFADLDGDGDLDAVIGETFGNLRYYRNTGTALAPVFTEQTGTANPFNGVDVGDNSTPSFADLDGDGDPDALIGELDGTLKYYRNNGTALAPVFTEQTGAANPFNGVDVGSLSAPSFADLDGDGDLDAVIGEELGTLNYYRNNGSGFVLAVTVTAQNENPFTTGSIFDDRPATGDFFVGEVGAGQLDVTLGSIFSITAPAGQESSLHLGRPVGGNGTVNISGAGSLVDVVATGSAASTGAFVNIGRVGSGTMNISNGGSLKVRDTVGTSYVYSSGNGGEFINVGREAGGVGSLNLNAGNVEVVGTSAYLQVGRNSGNGTVTATNGSSLIFRSTIATADSGLTVGRDTSGGGAIGVFTLDASSAIITGGGGAANGSDTYGAFVNVGRGFTTSQGTMTLQNNATLTVNGTNSTLGTINGETGISVGRGGGNGTMSVLSGSDVVLNGGTEGAFVNVGRGGTGAAGDAATGAVGLLRVSGAGSTFLADTTGQAGVSIGRLAGNTGTLTVENGASFIARGDTFANLNVGFRFSSDSGTGGNGTVNVLSGATMTLESQSILSSQNANVTVGSFQGNGLINVDAGTLRVVSSQSTWLSIGQGGGNGTLSVLSGSDVVMNGGTGGAFVNVGRGGTGAAGDAATGAVGLLRVSGAGSTFLADSTGGTGVNIGNVAGNTGTLTVENDASFIARGDTFANLNVGFSFSSASGNGGNGTINVLSGATMTLESQSTSTSQNAVVMVGSNQGDGLINVDAGILRVISSQASFLSVGSAFENEGSGGTGTIRVQNGGLLEVVDGSLNAFLSVGRVANSTALIEVLSGGRIDLDDDAVSNSSLSVGDRLGNVSATVRVSGTNSIFEGAGFATFGRNTFDANSTGGNAQLIVENGGVFRADSNIQIGSGAILSGNNGTVNITNPSLHLLLTGNGQIGDNGGAIETMTVEAVISSQGGSFRFDVGAGATNNDRVNVADFLYLGDQYTNVTINAVGGYKFAAGETRTLATSLATSIHPDVWLDVSVTGQASNFGYVLGFIGNTGTSLVFEALNNGASGGSAVLDFGAASTGAADLDYSHGLRGGEVAGGRFFSQGQTATGVVSNMTEVRGTDLGDTLTFNTQIGPNASTTGYTILGRGGNDTISGSQANDTINGGDGIDTLSYASATSGAGILFYMLAANLNGGDAAGDIYSLFENVIGTSVNDRIYMDNGANSVEGGGGAFDTAELYGGNDSYLGGSGFDYVLAGAGNDVISVGDGGSLIYGEGDDDSITATSGSNNLNGGDGNDTLTGGSGQDVIFGGTGLDSILGGSGDDFLFGEAGNDTISGDDGNDLIQGGSGLDSLFGNAGVDVILGGADADFIDGGSEGDFVFGEAGNDTVLGGAGNDQVFGGADNDSLIGNAGVDILNGGDGNDTLNDGGTLELTFSIGGNGNDTIIGTSGQDQMWGGTGSLDTGADVFQFGAGNGFDIIFDFQAGPGIVDQIRLVGTGIASFAQLQAENRIGQAGANTQINLPGSGNVIFLMNTTATTLVADDFLFT